MNIFTIIENEYCIGCGLCVSLSGTDNLEMIDHGDGFLVPYGINGFDGEIEHLDKICPGIYVNLDNNLTGDENMYGPYCELKIAWSTNPEIRYKGSSGGVITSILCALIDANEIDCVLQVSASKSNPIKTEATLSKSKEDIINCCGSRYAPSSIFSDLLKILEGNKSVAIVGKPCDIVAISNFKELFPEYASRIYCTLSFMCMGMPSQNATHKLIDFLGIQELELIKSLNYRGSGWPGRATINTVNDEEVSCSYSQSWGDILGRDVHFRCKICPDGWGSFADISCGDAWYNDGKNPIFNETEGRSLLFIRSKLGVEIISKIDKAIEQKDFDINALPIIQKSQHLRKHRLWSSYLILKLCGDRILNFRGLGLKHFIFKVSPFSVIKNIFGFIKRMPRRSRFAKSKKTS